MKRTISREQSSDRINRGKPQTEVFRYVTVYNRALVEKQLTFKGTKSRWDKPAKTQTEVFCYVSVRALGINLYGGNSPGGFPDFINRFMNYQNMKC